MKFIEDDRAQVGEGAIVLQPAQEDALGHVADTGAQAGLVIEANLVTDLGAERAPPFPGYARRHGPRRHATGLEHDNLLAGGQSGIQQHLRDLSGLAGAGGRYQDQPVAGM